MQQQEDSLMRHINEGIRRAIAEEMEKAIEEAKVSLDGRLRKVLAQVAMELSNHYSMVNNQQELVITVRKQEVE